jgi:hypothetical protein
MTQYPTTHGRTSSLSTLGLALLIAAAIVAVMALLTVVFGVQAPGPIYDIVPDPAGWAGLPF